VHKWTDKEGGETPARPTNENTELDSDFDFKGKLLVLSILQLYFIIYIMCGVLN